MNLDRKSKEKRDTAMSFSSSEFERLVTRDLTSSSAGSSGGSVAQRTQSEVREILGDYKNESNQRALVEISEALYVESPQYQRLIKHFANMLTFSYVVTPKMDASDLSLEQKKEQFTEVASLAKKMSFKHEFTKVLTEAYKTDVFYGYVHMTDDDFYIQKIPHEICKISSVEYGVYNYSIDMTHFDADTSQLRYYAPEIAQKYEEWLQIKDATEQDEHGNDIEVGDWMELDPENTICIKINEHMLYVVPPFSGSFDSVYEIKAFKNLRLDKAELDNYMMLVQSIPMRTNSEENNDFLIDFNMANYYHNMVSTVAPENVGVITSPMEIKPAKFDRDRVDSDGVAKAERDFWSGNGTSQALFSSDNNTSEGIKSSIGADENVAFMVLNQLERWTNRFMLYHTSSTLYSIDFLAVTWFNRDKVVKELLDSSTYGLPNKMATASVLGVEPISIQGMAELENDVLNLDSAFVPLASSHTQSSRPGDEGGRPTNDEAGVPDSPETDKQRARSD